LADVALHDIIPAGVLAVSTSRSLCGSLSSSRCLRRLPRRLLRRILWLLVLRRLIVPKCRVTLRGFLARRQGAFVRHFLLGSWLRRHVAIRAIIATRGGGRTARSLHRGPAMRNEIGLYPHEDNDDEDDEMRYMHILSLYIFIIFIYKFTYFFTYIYI
jgi:hypothetical protein